ncbi:PQQ-binding-like beta-propeller repeat protein [Chloroflexia bacterium SDU3-3]|nr:PQQ-binding-like beta-propeller repeat protein [Chloroflexia bacterium SDU3-3]
MCDMNLVNHVAPEIAPPLHLVWRYHTRVYNWATAAIQNGRVYISPNRIIAMELETGALIYETGPFPGIRHILHLTDGLLMFAYDDGIGALHQADGLPAWQVTTKNVREMMPLCEQGIAYWLSHTPFIDTHVPRRSYLYAYDIHQQHMRWRADLGIYVSKSFIPALDQGVIFGICDQQVAALRTSDGSLIWSTPLEPGEKARWNIVADGTTVYVPLECGRLLALDRGTGQVRWAIPSSLYHPQRQGINAHTGVTLADQRLYLGTDAGISCVDAATGAIIWERERDTIRGRGAFRCHDAPPLVSGAYLYVPSSYGLSCLDRSTGEELWVYSTRGEIRTALAAADGYLVFGCHDGYYYCFADDTHPPVPKPRGRRVKPKTSESEG